MFRGFDPERDRLVAIKLFRLDLAPDRVHRLVAALQRLTSGALNHPAMAAPIAAGMQENTAYLVQEYVAADSLDVVLRDQGPAPLVDALRVVRQLAEAIDAGVAHGAIHARDVLLSPHEVRVTGFGIVPALEQVGVAAPLRRPYTAPERLAGAAWDRRADMFSIAAVMYEVLVGKRITGTGEAGASGLTELAGVDVAALRAVFGRALAEDPSDRFESGSAFADALIVASRRAAAAGRARQPRTGDQLASDDERQATDDDGLMIGDDRLATLQPELPLQIELAALQPGEPPEPPSPPQPPEPQPPPVPPGEPHPSPPRVPPPLAAADSATVPEGVKPARRVRAPFEPAFGPAVERPAPPILLTALDRSRSAMWPLALAFVVGSGVGIAVGFSLYPMMNFTAAVDGGGVADSGAAQRSLPAAQAPPAAAQAPVSPAPQPVAPENPVPVDTPPEKPAARSASASAAPPAPPPPAAAPARASSGRAAAAESGGRVLVRSTPAGARVVVDGRDRGISPAEVRGLTNGPHTVRVVREGFEAVERTIVITAADPAQNVTIPMPPVSASRPGVAPAPAGAAELRIESRPAGADVFIDGRLVGTTPMVVSGVAAGAHAVRMELDGYQPWTASTTVAVGGDNRVTGSLER